MEDNFIVLNIGHAQTVHKWMNEDISSPFVRLFYVITFRTLLYALSTVCSILSLTFLPETRWLFSITCHISTI